MWAAYLFSLRICTKWQLYKPVYHQIFNFFRKDESRWDGRNWERQETILITETFPPYDEEPRCSADRQLHPSLRTQVTGWLRPCGPLGLGLPSTQSVLEGHLSSKLCCLWDVSHVSLPLPQEVCMHAAQLLDQLYSCLQLLCTCCVPGTILRALNKVIHLTSVHSEVVTLYKPAQGHVASKR
jgi:hypothetical protein